MTNTILHRLIVASALLALPLGAIAQSDARSSDAIHFGDDSGDYANDGECDDPRFTGSNTAKNLDWTVVGQDATDCRQSLKKGSRYWVYPDEIKVVDCSGEDFGDDSSQFNNSGTCDDPRYFGIKSAQITMATDSGKDATDCQRACELNLLYARPAD